MVNGKNAKKTVLITGITSRIGYATARVFAAEGWSIIGHYCSASQKAAEIEKNLIMYGKARILLYKADFSLRKDILKFVDLVGPLGIDSIVNNAGTYIAKRHFGGLTLSDLEGVFNVNVFAPILIAGRLFPKMRERKFGRIVNISSIAAKYGGSACSMHYGCSKRALEGMTKTLAKEGARHNVLVNTIRPGVIDTDFHKRFHKDMKSRIEMIPVKRLGRPRDIADMAYYLGSDKNNFITNEIIAVAGGE